MKYIGNAFSLQMLESFPTSVRIERVDEKTALSKNNLSVVGHPDTAKVLGIKCNRVNISLKKGDILYVAQLQGGRLPEGATTLPDGFSFNFLRVEVV